MHLINLRGISEKRTRYRVPSQILMPSMAVIKSVEIKSLQLIAAHLNIPKTT